MGKDKLYSIVKKRLVIVIGPKDLPTIIALVINMVDIIWLKIHECRGQTGTVRPGAKYAVIFVAQTLIPHWRPAFQYGLNSFAFLSVFKGTSDNRCVTERS